MAISPSPLPSQELAPYRGRPNQTSNQVLLLEPAESETVHAAGGNSLEEMWQILRSRAWLIAVLAVAGGIIGTVASFIQSPKYRAQTDIEIQAPVESPMGFQSAAPGTRDTTPDYVHTQVKILQSRLLRQRVIKRLAAANKLSTYDPLPPLDSWRNALGLKIHPRAAIRPRVPELALRVVSDNTDVVAIICESPDPKFAAEYANTMSDEYIQLQIESRWDASQRTTAWLSKQLEDLQQKLQQSESKLEAYNRSAGMIFGDEMDTTAQEKLKQLQSELSHASADRVEKQSVYEITTSGPADSVPQVVDNTRLSGYQSKLADLNQQLVELSALYTPDHYKVKQVQAQIKELKAIYDKERGSVLDRIHNDFLAAARREELLKNAYRAQESVVADRATKMDQYSVLKREVDTDRQLYGALLQRIKEAGVASAAGATNIRVVDAAEVSGHPFEPSLAKNISTGFGGGILLGLVLAFVIERVNRSLKSPGEVSLHLRVPALGVIPQCDLGLIRRPGRVDPLEVLNGNGNAPVPDERVELVTWQDSPSVVAESFRSVITSILLSDAKGRPPKVIVVTSAARQDGKSTTVSNLGLALAEIGQKVLLIDADMRKPRLHQIFDVRNSWGLSDLLREKSSLKDCPLEAIARKTHINNVYLLPSGPATLSISNLLYSNRMIELLDRLRSEFDTVLIDTPPLMYISDARVLGRLAEGAILVIRSGETTRDAAMSAKQRLVDDGVWVVGTILNRWDPKSKDRYSNYYYERDGQPE
jgi:capsular exopolysaccharide synthesis family protein